MQKIILAIFYTSLAFFSFGQSGTLNKNFGNNGVVRTIPSTNVEGSTLNAVTRACFTQSNGKILTLVELGGSTVISRRLSSGIPDSSYGTNSFSVPVAITNPVGLLQPDGKFLVAGITVNGPQDAIIARYAANGTLDGSFGNSGVMITDFGSSSDEITSLAIQPDGKIIGGGASFRNSVGVFALVRYTTAGKPDPGFGAGGIVITIFDNSAGISGIAVQPDGRVVAAGDYNNGNGNFALARYKANGSPDTSFNHTGTLVFSSGNYDNVTSLALQGGKILAGGYFFDPTGGVHFEIARVTTGGSLDLSFGGAGFVMPNFGNNDEFLEALSTESNGSFIAAGYSELPSGMAVFAIERFIQSGLPDNSFGTSGQVLTTISDTTSDFLNCISITSGGQLLAGGESSPVNGNLQQFSVVRYTSSGALDNSFGQDGILVADHPDQSISYSQVFIEPDGKLLVPGEISNESTGQNFIARFTSGGKIDPTYGQQGTANTVGFDNIMQPDGRMVESGDTTVSGIPSLLLKRYKTTGAIDGTFGTGGSTAINFFGETEFSGIMALQPDQKIIASGFISNDGNNDILLARFNAAGILDASFGNGGAVAAGFELFNNVQSLAVATNGKILVAGSGFTPSFQLVAYLARFNSNGGVDSSFGQNGVLVISAGAQSFTGTVIPLSTGKILFAYEISPDFSSFNSFVTRYNLNGSVDSSFGTYGTIPLPGSGILLEPDQKIISLGRTRDLQDNEEFVISRYLANGKPDLGFGTKGSTESNLSPVADIPVSGAVTGTNIAIAGYIQDPNAMGLLAEYLLGPQLSAATNTVITVPTDPGGCTTTLKSIAKKIEVPDGIIPTVSGVTTARITGELSAFSFNKGENRLVFYLDADSAFKQETVINVVDREDPVISAVANSIPEHTDADGSITLQLGYSVSDNCGSVRTTIASDGQILAINDHTIRFTPNEKSIMILRIRATDESGNQSEKIDSVMLPESLLASFADLSVTATPNPSNGEFILHVRAAKQNMPVILELYDALGTRLQSPLQTLAGQTTHLGAGLLPGTYFLKVIQGNIIRMSRLVKR